MMSSCLPLRQTALALGCLLALTSTGWIAGLVHAEDELPNWATRLGYPADKQVVILYGSSMGLCYEANQAGQVAMTGGSLRSASAMVPCPWFGDFARWARQQPDLDLGVSLTMTSDLLDYRWAPVAKESDVPTLVDADGYLCRTVPQFSYNAEPAQVRLEMEAQLAKARAAGLRPTHLSPYLGAVLARPDFMAEYLAVARKHWLPAVVVELTPAHLKRFRENGFPLDQQTIDLVAAYPLPKLDDLRFSPEADSLEAKRTAVTNLVKSLSPGLTMLVFRPAVESPALKRLVPDWQQRVWDGQLLADGKLAEELESQGVILTNWSEVMRRFDPESSPQPSSSPAAAAATTAPAPAQPFPAATPSGDQP